MTITPEHCEAGVRKGTLYGTGHSILGYLPGRPGPSHEPSCA